MKDYKPNKMWIVYGDDSYLSESLQQVAARNRQSDVYVVHDEERLLLTLVWKTRQVVCYEQEHVHLRLLQGERKKVHVKTFIKIVKKYIYCWQM